MTLTDFYNARDRLIASGWTYTHTVMNDSGTGGMVFVKGGEKFTLNGKTIGSLPVSK